MSAVPIPKPCDYLDEMESLGAFNGHKRWRNKDGKLFVEWDSLHGEIEVYNKRGKHLGVYNCDGDMIKKAVKGRTIDV